MACLEAGEKRQMKGVHCGQPPAQKLPTNNDKDVATCDTAGYVWGCDGAWEKQGYLVITARPPPPVTVTNKASVKRRVTYTARISL